MKKGFVIGLLVALMLMCTPTYAGTWQQDSTGWWYQNDDGTYPVSSWLLDTDGYWYYFDSSGYMYANSWYYVDGAWYCCDASGRMLSSTWFQSGGDWYYMDSSGRMLSSTWIGNYYLGSNGAMLVSAYTPDGYYVGADGIWIEGYGKSNTTHIYTRSAKDNSSSDTDGSSSSTDNSSSNAGSGSSSSSSTYTTAMECFDLINEQRVAAGLSALEHDATLQQACDIRAAEIVTKFSHTRPDGTSFYSVLSEVGFSSNGYGENIAAGQTAPTAVVNSWMNSSGHKANILKEGYTRGAIGYYYDPTSSYGHYWVQIFSF